MHETQLLLRRRVKALFEEGVIGSFIGWQRGRRGAVRCAVIRSAHLADSLVWDSDCTVPTAKYALDERYPEKKIGIALRGCDSRAVQRMLEDCQLRREDIYLIGLPCPGMGMDICSRCRSHSPALCDELLPGQAAPDYEGERFAAVKELEALPGEERRRYWQEAFSRCLHCYACRNVCPACNCRECYLDEHRTGWEGKRCDAARNGVYGMTRAFHVGDRCIECGQCERVCPMDIPIMSLTQKMLKDINELFGDYECGFPDSRPHILGEFDLGDADDFE